VQGQVNVGQQQAFAPAQGEIAKGNHPDILASVVARPLPQPGEGQAVLNSRRPQS
jgi:hypothetical protein